LKKKSILVCFWVAQRFTAAINGLFSVPDSAAEGGLRRFKPSSANSLTAAVTATQPLQ
jgi:hypothetical protein